MARSKSGVTPQTRAALRAKREREWAEADLVADGRIVARTCSKCAQRKPIALFSPSPRSRGGRNRRCKQCVSDHSNERQKRLRKAGELKKYPARPDRVRRYGIDDQTWAAALDAQDGRCLICCDAMPAPQIDHCHTTGQVRGILCRHCNWALGHLRDRADLARRAIAYLDRELLPARGPLADPGHGYYETKHQKPEGGDDAAQGVRRDDHPAA